MRGAGALVSCWPGALSTPSTRCVSESRPRQADTGQITPLEYLNAIYAEWIPLGLWIILLPFLPETPWFYARKARPEAAKKVMAKLYKGVEGYDIDYEYTVMCERIAEEKAKDERNASVRWLDIVRGTDLVS